MVDSIKLYYLTSIIFHLHTNIERKFYKKSLFYNNFSASKKVDKFKLKVKKLTFWKDILNIMNMQSEKNDTFSKCEGNNSMKKLAYIILVIAILLIISHFVKNGALVAQEMPQQEVKVSEQISVSNEVQKPSEGADVVEVQETVKTPETQAADSASEIENIPNQEETVEDIIISDEEPEEHDAIDVEETSAETFDEEETVLPE